MMSSPGHHENGSISSSSVPSSITSTTYPSVTHKKVEGTVILTDSGMTFYPATVGAPASTPMLWTAISKHQVSPLSHPKNLLKVILNASPDASSSNGNNNTTYGGSPAPSLPSSQSSSSFTFQLKSRGELERIRRDITSRLGTCRRILAQNAAPSAAQTNNRKRSFHDAMSLSSPVSNIHNHNHNYIASPVINKSKSMMESEYSSSTFTTLSPTTMAVTRSSILSSDATLRLQHSLLATNTNNNNNSTQNQNSPTISEDDFWSTHAQNLSTTAAKIHGLTARGHPSTLKSSLDLLPGKIKIGVEEMRQIFILYPAVHRAYEKKVPLELSEEQFWRKYLESEYFHRDRGRLGSHVGKAMSLERMEKEKMDASRNDKDGGAGGAGDDGTGDNDKKDDNKDDSNNNNNSNDTNEDEQNKNKSSKEQEENARVAAASSDDIFSRTDVELQRTNSERLAMWKKRIGIDLAVGQFDLAATANTERGGKLLLNAQDLHPGSSSSSRGVANAGRSSKGSLVIDKYNRHWAMVLNPEEATAGCALMSLARQSVHHVLPDDDDAKVSGGVRKEMQRLIGYANASGDRVDHVKGMGDGGPEDGSVLFEELKLIDVGAYSGESVVSGKHNGGVDGSDGPSRAISMIKKELEQKRHFAHIMAEKVKIMVAPILESNWDNDKVGGKNGNGNTNNAMLPDLEHAFPDSTFGRQLLSALTKRMALDAITEADAVKMANKLPEDFKKRLSLFFRRSSELLRHFFALRHVIEENKFTLAANNSNDTGTSDVQSSNKLKKIVKGMEGVYEEMEVVRKELPQTEIGENMRKMCLPIMEQLDSAFKLHRSSGSGGGGFGFVSVD